MATETGEEETISNIANFLEETKQSGNDLKEDTKAKFIMSEADPENQESIKKEEKTSTNESEDIKETQEMQDSQEL